MGRPAREPVWQKRFYDFNVWSARKQVEKLRYMHGNPVKRGLVERPEQWKWSSFRAYGYGFLSLLLWRDGTGSCEVSRVGGEIKPRPVQGFAEVGTRPVPCDRSH